MSKNKYINILIVFSLMFSLISWSAGENYYQKMMEFDNSHQKGLYINQLNEDQLIQLMDQAWKAGNEGAAELLGYKLGERWQEKPSDPDRYLKAIKNEDEKFNENVPAILASFIVYDIQHWSFDDKCSLLHLILQSVESKEMSQKTKSRYLYNLKSFLEPFLKELDKDTSLDEAGYVEIDRELNGLFTAAKQEIEKEVVVKDGRDFHLNFMRFLRDYYNIYNQLTFKHPERVSNTLQNIQSVPDIFKTELMQKNDLKKVQYAILVLGEMFLIDEIESGFMTNLRNSKLNKDDPETERIFQVIEKQIESFKELARMKKQ